MEAPADWCGAQASWRGSPASSPRAGRKRNMNPLKYSKVRCVKSETWITYIIDLSGKVH